MRCCIKLLHSIRPDHHLFNSIKRTETPDDHHHASAHQRWLHGPGIKSTLQGLADVYSISRDPWQVWD